MSGKDICLRFGTSTHARKLSVREMSVGRFSNGNGNENVKKSIGLWLHDCLRLPRLQTTNTRQLEILVTTLIYLVNASLIWFLTLFFHHM